MLVPFFFVVEPRVAWSERLRNELWARDSDLLHPRLWEQRRPDRLAFEREPWLLRFKLLFLLDIGQLLRAEQASEELLEEFAPERVLESLFDRYFQCRVFESCEDDASVEREIESRVFARIPRTGCAEVDDWLNAQASR